MDVLNVDLGCRSYPIMLGKMSEWLPELIRLIAGKQVLVVTDSNIAATNLPGQLLSALENAGQSSCKLLIIPAGEEFKTMATVEKIAMAAAEAGLDRRGIMIALSGGVVGDLTGFAAAIYMRGIKFIQLPTTLLAAVDSSVGGKTGADLVAGKNLVGAFHQPEMVAMDMDFLATLPADQWCNGLAEVVKYGVIMDEKFFDLLEKNAGLLKKLDRDFYARVIYHCCECKARVVASDEQENGLRAILNYGHTAGHAVEKLSNYTLPHGMAVAVGMAVAARLAVLMNIFPEAQEIRQNRLLEELGLPVRLPENSNVLEIIDAMHSDKKNSNNRITMVLPRSIGEVEIMRDVDEKLLLEALEALL